MAPVVRVTASDKVLSVVTAGATRSGGGGGTSVTVGVKGDINVVTADGDWQIVAGSIVNADIAAGAAIAQSKVANLTTDLSAKAPSAGPTFTGTVTTAASTTGAAGLRVPQGTAPTSPANGDVWMTAAGMYVRANGLTLGPFSSGGGSGDMLKSENLSGLANYVTARSNLGLGEKNAANGIAGLDAGAKVLYAQLPTGTTASTVAAGDDSRITGAAPLASPTFTGTPAAPTAAANTNTTQLATTAFVTTADNLKAPLASPTFTGTPAAPTAAANTNTTQLATTAFVTTADNLKAPLASPALTGTPTAPTATPGTSTTQIATTAFVAAAGVGSGVTVQDQNVQEGTGITTLDFAGAGVSVAVTGAEAVVTIPGGGSSDPDVINVKTAHNCVGDAVKLTGTVAQSSTSVNITSAGIPTGFNTGRTAVIEGAGSADGSVPHVSTFTWPGSGNTITLTTAAPFAATSQTIWLGTNDTTNLIAARDAWLASAKDTAVEGRIATKRLFIPSGSYIYTGTDLFMTDPGVGVSTQTIRANVVEGSIGGPASRIVFASPTTVATAADRSKGNLGSWRWRSLNFRMENIAAYSCNSNQSFAWMWTSSHGGGGQGNFKWENVELDGKWNSGWAFDGDRAANMNSEQQFDHCITRYAATFKRAVVECGGTTETTVAAGSAGQVLSATLATLNVADTTNFPVTTHAISQRSASGTSRTLWLPVGHEIYAAGHIEISGINANYNGLFKVDSSNATAGTVTYTHTATLTEAQVASGGTVVAGSEGYVETTQGWRKIWYANKTAGALTGVRGGNTVAEGQRVVHASDQQDQFLNYEFVACNFEYRKGDTLRFWKGGSVRVVGGSWILGISESGTATDTGSFFVHPYATHFDNVCSLHVMGTRFERRTQSVMLYDSYWFNRNQHMTFDTILFLTTSAVSNGTERPMGTLRKNIDGGFDRMPNIQFRNSSLSGHLWRTGRNDTSTAVEAGRGAITVDQCNLTDPTGTTTLINTTQPQTGANNTVGFFRWDYGLPAFSITRTANIPDVSRGIDAHLQQINTTPSGATTTIVPQRLFVGSVDPAASAATGDIWIQF